MTARPTTDPDTPDDDRGDGRGADALLLLSSACPHCAASADALMRLVKEGEIGHLEVINLDRRPEQAAAYGVRGVPWQRIGQFELEGAIGYGALKQWARHAAAGSGFADYALRLLDERRLERVASLVRERPERLAALLDTLADDDTPMSARIGISAVVEELAGSPELRRAVAMLEQLTLSERPDLRADACHFLGLAGDPAAAASVRRLLDDEYADVREIAAETLALLDASPTLSRPAHVDPEPAKPGKAKPAQAKPAQAEGERE
ncbi:MAG: HEAT repeat domain-containing protein [Thiohalocapsa sp.]|nr:HEAT repeat domain-containing protein [Thiohalocapsa sp.]